MSDIEDIAESPAVKVDCLGTMPDLSSHVAERRRTLPKRRVVERGGAVVAVAVVGVLGVTAINGGGDSADVVTRTPTAEPTVADASSPELIPGSVNVPVPYIAAVMEDHSLVLLDAATGAEIREILPSPERQPMVDGVLAIIADGRVIYTTTTGRCGEVRTEHVDGGGELPQLDTSRAVFSPDGAVWAARLGTYPDCDTAPWSVDRAGLLDVPVDVLLNGGGIPIVAWTEASQVFVAEASDLEPTAVGVTGRAEAGNWPDLVIAEPDGGHVSVDLVTGQTTDLAHGLGTVLAVDDDYLLALSSVGELAVVSPSGDRRVVAVGVIDASWGPTPLPEPVAQVLNGPPVGQVAVLRTDGSVELLAATDGSPLGTVEVPRVPGSRVLDLLALDAFGQVLLTTDEGECGTLRESGRESARLSMSLALASPDGAVVAVRRPVDGCSGEPWVLASRHMNLENPITSFELDHPVDGLAVTSDGSVAVVWNEAGQVRWRHVETGGEEARTIDVPIDDFAAEPTDPRFTLGAVGEWPNVVLTTESPNQPGEYSHRWIDVETGELGRVVGPSHRVVAAHAGHLLVLSSNGELSRVDPDGAERTLATEVVDAVWGPISPRGPDPVFPIRVEPISLSGAPGDPIDIVIPGVPMGGIVVLDLADEPGRRALVGHVQGDELRPRLVTTVPWGTNGLEPLPTGRYDLKWVSWELGPIVIGTIDITEPGALPAPVGTPPDALPILRPGGLGDVDFGVTREVVEAYMTVLLGSAPVLDPRFGSSNFGGLALGFSLEGTWTSWSYSGEPGGGVVLSTPEGITIGLNVGDLVAAYPAGGFGSCIDGLGSDAWLSATERPRYEGWLSDDVEQMGATLASLSARASSEIETC